MQPFPPDIQKGKNPRAREGKHCLESLNNIIDNRSGRWVVRAGERNKREATPGIMGDMNEKRAG